jgi:hypothetical protein
MPSLPPLVGLLTRTFLSDLLRTPEGRAFVLQQLADAESTDEGALFDHILASVDDPEIGRMVRKHKDDETRHAALFSERARAQGVDVGPVVPHLRLLRLLDGRLGHFLSRPVRDRRDVMESYLVLQVIEERALTQFGPLERAMRAFDPKSAGAIAVVARDEERHLRYCHAIARRFAPDEGTRATTLRRYRDAEVDAFRDHQQATARHILETGYLTPGRTGLWRAVLHVTSRLKRLPYTPYALADA